MRINFACGRRTLDGYYNIDAKRHRAAKRDPELIHEWAPDRPLPLPDACADEILAIHIFEHFFIWDAAALVADWRRLLKPGALLVLELPDLEKCCANVLKGVGIGADGGKGDALGMWGIYGDPSDRDPYMTHRWGWTPQTLTAFLGARGFAKIREETTQWHPGGRNIRDMRIVAIKA